MIVLVNPNWVWMRHSAPEAPDRKPDESRHNTLHEGLLRVSFDLDGVLTRTASVHAQDKTSGI
jgi:hypothetical protein